MTVDFYSSKVKDTSHLFNNGQLTEMSRAITFCLMDIGVNSVKADNIAEILWRIHAVNSVGSFWTIPVEMWERSIGLTTNVTDESRTRWIRRMARFEKVTPKAMRARFEAAQPLEGTVAA